MNPKFNDKEYWSKYYDKLLAIGKPTEPSPFAKYLIENNIIKPNQLAIELGCGNGRDAIFFAKNNVKVIAIDQCKNTTTILNQLENIESYPADFTELPPHDKEINVVYSRFTMHSIAEVEENNTLKWVFDNLENQGLICIEVRTTKDPLCGKGIDKGNNVWFYNNHHRRFVSANNFRNKLLQIGFKISLFEENNGFAPYKDEDPIVLRVIASKK